MSNLIGQSLGRYHILEQLGEGGMAIVYKAYDTRLERDVAVKVIRTEKLTIETMGRTLKRFEREAKALAKLTHPNIVPITDYGEHDEKPYLVMPYLPGGTLKQQLKGKPMPWEDSVRLLIPIARALHYAHQQGIIHRDVKPSNILITESGEPMLTDFGIAKILLDNEETADLTGTGMGVGTPEYMSPEQFQGKGVDARTDVYSLGVVLYEMITGRKPYQADTPAAVLIKQATEPLPKPKSFVPNLPDVVEKMLLKALAKNKEDRFQDVAALGNGLETLLMGMGKEKKPATKSVKPNLDTQGTVSQGETSATINQEIETGNLLHKTRNPTWRNVLWIILGWIIGLAIGGVIGLVVDDAFYGIAETIGWAISWIIGLAIGGTIMIWHIRKLSIAQKQRGRRGWIWLVGGIGIICLLALGIPIVHWISNIPLSQVTDFHVPTESLTPAESPTQTLIPYHPIISPENADKLIELSSYNFPELARQSDEYGTAFSLDWSPDGNEIAVVPWLSNPNAIIYFFDKMLTTYNQVNLDFEYDYNFQYSPKGNVLAINSDAGKVYLIGKDGSEISMLHAVNDQPDVAFSIDGELLATGGYGTEVRFWQVNDGHLIRSLDVLDGDLEGGLGVTFSPDGKYFVTKNRNGRVRLWDQFANPIFSFDKSMVQDAEFNPSGTTVAVAYVDGTVGLWDVSTGNQIELIDGGMDEIYNVAWSPNGKVLAWCGHYGQITLWDVEERKVLIKVGNSEWNLELEFSPDGKFLLSSAYDIVQLWGVP